MFKTTLRTTLAAALLASSTLLAACGTTGPTPYQPAAGYERGYSATVFAASSETQQAPAAEIPAKMPSSRASRRAISSASAWLTDVVSSMCFGS